ncbi:TauD/TfdA dioxygenase family protein [Bordetella sp. 02P26C-1]|uniref:TauD/TfdA dioxygenase family protein n=1 Tax=Bordetella sp. 02P26C-1 TaxID=2683195 RepID=UPI0013532CAD|nr:TauD/TfdA family dioxygenase [Bordetella sp. 02P26C-1]MVW80662.1 TauD/TfdA family dioxygenase [Bordetella sp. 02P26C-1]
MIELTVVRPDFVAEVYGLNLAQGLSADDAQALRAAVDQYAVLVFPDQPLTEAQQLEVAKVFGPLEISVGASVYNAQRPRRLGHAELSDISNLDEKGQILDAGDIRRLINLSNQLWHTDSSFKRTPASVSLLSAQEIPPVGGATEFADMTAVWDALDPDMQTRLLPLIATHDYFHSRGLTGFDVDGIPPAWREMQPPVRQVLVRQHAATGKHSLYLASHISGIEGMDVDKSRALVDDLMAFATQAQFVYRHRWRVDDLVLWDNRRTMHRGTGFDERFRRSMRRATVQDAGPTVS